MYNGGHVLQKYLDSLTPPQKGLLFCHSLLLLYSAWVFLPEFLPTLAQGLWYEYAVAAALVLPLCASLLFIASCFTAVPRFFVAAACVAALLAGFILSFAGEFSGGGLVLLLYAATLFILNRA